MDQPIILFKLTTRSRPDWCFRAIDSVINNLHDKVNYRILVSCDIDDPTMNNREVIDKFRGYRNLYTNYAMSKSKMDAINRDSCFFPNEWHILVNLSDDQVFTSMFFDKTIRACFNGDFDLAIHLPDQATKAALMTMAIIGVDYYNRFGYIYHPDYISLFCDNEMQDVARILGKYKYINVDIFKHLHWAWGLAEKDAQYTKTESFYRIDEQTYERRKKINFGL